MDDYKPFYQDEVSDFIKQELAKQNEPLEMIYVGFSPHDCESLYKCPTCGHICGSWDFVNGTIKAIDNKFKCRVCNTILREPR